MASRIERVLIGAFLAAAVIGFGWIGADHDRWCKVGHHEPDYADPAHRHGGITYRWVCDHRRAR